jgi:predicted MPP superfamily phosphohydrolase
MIFFIVLTLAMFLSYTYIGWRLIKPSTFPVRKKRLAWAILLIMPLLVPLSFLLQITMEGSSWSDVLGWVAYISMGFFSLLFALLLTRDLFWGIVRIARKIASFIRAISFRKPIPSNDPTDPERRQFFIQSMNLGIVGLSTLMTGFGIYEARRQATLVEVSVPLPGLPPDFDGYRIAQITDIHVGPTIKREYVEMVADEVNRLHADMIALTGDLIDGSVPGLRDEVAPLRDLDAPDGKYFVTGNHEYYSGVTPWIDEVGRMGFTVLMNEHRILRKGPAGIVLAGVTDYHAGRFVESHASDPAEAIAGAPEGLVRILLAHQPRSIHAASRLKYDLQISGHTHGGQYLYGNLLVAMSQPYLKGLHFHEGTWIYISTGTGYWGPPLRLGVPSEITVITLKKGDPKSRLFS